MYKLARNLEFPPDYTTHCVGILGQRGSGKTTAAIRLAEQMVAQERPVVVIDPTGVWWGLRLMRNGKDPNPHEVLIVGGRHGDLPLPLAYGDELARYVCTEAVSVILDLSQHRQDEWEPFAADFVEGLYRHCQDARHVFIDEADLLAPQMAQRGRLGLRNRVEDLVRRGRSKGLGVTMITQRAADLAKGVLGQVEALIVGRLMGRNDWKVVESWVEANGTPAQMEELIGSLAALETGSMWVWSPQWLDCFKRVHVMKRETFDSSATPEAGANVRSARPLAAIDVEGLRQLLADDQDAVPGDDEAAEEIRRLRERVRVLERELEEAREGQIAPLVEHEVNEIESRISNIRGVLSRPVAGEGERQAGAKPAATPPARSRGRAKAAAPPEKSPRPRPTRPVKPFETNGSSPGLGKPHQRILEALAWWESVGIREPTRVQVALVARYAPSSGHTTNVLSEMRKENLLTYPNTGHVAMTEAGRKKAPSVDLAGTEAALQSRIFAVLNGPQERVMRHLIHHQGSGVRRVALAEGTNFSAGSGHFTNVVSSLSKLKLVDYPRQGEVRAAEVVFLRE